MMPKLFAAALAIPAAACEYADPVAAFLAEHDTDRNGSLEITELGAILRPAPDFSPCTEDVRAPEAAEASAP